MAETTHPTQPVDAPGGDKPLDPKPKTGDSR